LEAALEEKEDLLKKLDKTQRELGDFVSEKYYNDQILMEKDGLLSGLNEKMEEINSANSNLKQYLQKSQTLANENKKLESENANLLDRVREAIQLELDLKEQKREFQTKYEDVNRRLDSLAEPERKVKELKGKLRDRDDQIINMVLEMNRRNQEIDKLLMESEDRRKKVKELTEVEDLLKAKVQNLEEIVNEQKRQKDEVLQQEKEKLILEMQNKGLTGEMAKVNNLSLELRRKDEEIKDLNETIRGLNTGNADVVPAYELRKVKVDLDNTRNKIAKKDYEIERLVEEVSSVRDELKKTAMKKKDFESKIEEQREEVNRLVIKNNELNVKYTQGVISSQNLETDIKELKEIIEYKNKLNKLETEKIMDLRTRLVEVENEKRLSEEKAKMAEREAKRVTMKVEGLERANQELEENQIYHTTNFIDKMKSKDADLNRKIADLNYKEGVIKRMTDRRDELEHKVKMLEQAVRGQGGIVSGDVSQMTTSMNRSRIRGSNPLAVLSQIDSVAKLKENNNRLKREIEELNRRIKEMDRMMEGKVHRFVDDNETLEKKVEDLEKRLKEKENVEKKMKSFDNLKAKFKDLIIRHEKSKQEVVAKEKLYKEKINEMAVFIEEMNGEIEQKIQKSQIARVNKKNLEEQLAKEIKKKDTFQTMLKKAQDRNLLLEEQLKNVKGDAEFLGREFEVKKKLDKEILELKQNKLKLERRIKDLEEENKRILDLREKDKLGHEDLVNKKNKEFDDQEVELNKVRAARDRVQKELNKLQEEKNKLANDLEKVKGEKESITKALDQLKDEQKGYIGVLEKEKEKQAKNIMRKKQEIITLNERLEKDSKENTKALVKENVNLKNQIEKYDVLIDKTAKKVKGLKEENDQLKEVINKIKSDPKTGKEVVNGLNDEIVEMKFKVDNMIKSFERQRDKMKKENKGLKENLTKANVQISDIQNQKDLMALKVKEVEEKNRDLEKKIQELL
jgi:chromosome segregation ATPase